MVWCGRLVCRCQAVALELRPPLRLSPAFGESSKRIKGAKLLGYSLINLFFEVGVCFGRCGVCEKEK